MRFAYDRTIKPPRGAGIHRVMQMLLLSWQSQGLIATFSKIIAAMFMALLAGLWNVRLFAFWFFSKRVSDIEYRDRMSDCGGCDSMTIDADGKKWCGSCGCPHWRYSELTVKNRYAGHNCPRGIHVGSIPLPVIAQPEKSNGGCAGCGETKT